MEDIRWTTELLHPTELEAGSIAEVVFRYSNQNEYDHRIRSVVIAPSWDLTQEIEVSITDGLVVPSKEEKCLPATKIEIPSEIGGRQGFRVGFELSEYTKNNNYSFKTRWDGSISRVEVRDANEYRPLLCVSGGDEDVSVIRELIYNWGFDVQEVHNQQDVVGYFNKNEDKPIAAFGAAFPNDNDSSSRPLLNTTVSVALSYDVIAVVFKHASADLPDLPDTCVIIEFDPTDELDLEIQSFSLFLEICGLKETNQMNKFVRWIKNHSKKKAKDLLDSWVQSVILSAIGAATVADHPISTIKEFISDLQTADHANIKILDVEHFNENEINVRRVTIVAQEDVNLFGWTMKTDARHSNDYDFGSILLSAGGIYDITDLGLGFFDYENETTLSIYNAQNQLVVEETIPPSTVDSHRILIRVIDADGNPIEDEPITIGGERAVREEQYKTNAEGEVIYGLTRRIPTDAFRREITIRDHSQYVGTDRGTRVVKFIITRDGSVKEACSN